MLEVLPWLLASLSAILLIAASALWWQGRRRRQPDVLPTEWALTARPVFNTDERRVYRQLREALPHHIVLSKLPLVRFCQPNDPAETRYAVGALLEKYTAYRLDEAADPTSAGQLDFGAAGDGRHRSGTEALAVHHLADALSRSLEAQGMAELYATIENPLVSVLLGSIALMQLVGPICTQMASRGLGEARRLKGGDPVTWMLARIPRRN